MSKLIGWFLCLVLSLAVYLWQWLVQQVTPRDDEDELDF
jgi:hypothetical protein